MDRKGTLLAIAIVLLWLAGLAFYIAFEGLQNVEQTDTKASGLIQAMLSQLGQGAAAEEGGS
jgi:hypothetical protein